MSLLDWSAPRKTPAGTRDGGSAPEQAPHAPGQPLTTRPAGSMRHHDDLCEALADYRETWSRGAYIALKEAALRCGMPADGLAAPWAEKRVATYRNMIGGAA